MKSENIEKQIRILDAIQNDIDEYRSYDTTHAYNKIKRRIEHKNRKQIAFNYFMRISAVFILPLFGIASFWGYKYFTEIPAVGNEISYYTVTSAPGVITQITLSDSSRVWLNGNSSLRYPARFIGNNRHVYLQGEGYFEVESDLSHPFFVLLNDDVKVKAFGTKFNISSYQDDRYIETTLESGCVDMTVSGQTVVLNPHHMVVFNRDDAKLSVREVNTYMKTAWKDGCLVFRNSDIEEVIRKIGRRYNVDIRVYNPNNKSYKVRAAFSDETIFQILNYLKLAVPLEWKVAKIEQNTDATFGRQQIDLWIN